jgi:predicted CXXCH cytochrome family protein
MAHLKRAAVLLVVVLVGLFVLPRVIPVPAALADFGFHQRNSERDTEKWAAIPMSFANTSVCTVCHKSQYDLWQTGNHRVVSCENCHGPATAHVEAGAPVTVDRSRDLCGTCHAKLEARPASFPQVDMKEMGGDAGCISCHNPHEPRAGMPPQLPHALEGRLNCQSCHDPQSHEPFERTPPQAFHTMEGRSDCTSCHGPAEIRGANLPHAPTGVAGTDCLTCHTAGGLRPLPADHAGRTSATCLNCHRID